MRAVRLIVVLVISSMAFQCLAQERDVELWTGVRGTYKVNKEISLGLDLQTRFRENITQHKTAFTQLRASYRFNKYVKLAGAYRFTNRNNLETGYSPEHRLTGALYLAYKAKPFMFAYRGRYQQQYVELYAKETQPFIERHNRNLFKVAFDLDQDLEPYVAYEFYYNLAKQTGSEIDNQRLILGSSYDFNDWLGGKVFYIYEHGVNRNNPGRTSIFGIRLDISIDKLMEVKTKASDA